MAGADRQTQFAVALNSTEMSEPKYKNNQASDADADQAVVTIGMPVYNGGRWLRASVQSLLDQTVGEFVLYICDNASTDNTESIAREFEAADQRVRYRRNEKNIGVYRNYDKAFSFAKSKYFKWSSCNDICAPTYLEKCLEILEEDDEVVLAYCGTTVFQDDPGDGESYSGDPEFTDSRPSNRFKRVLTEIELNNAFNGVIRTDTLRDTSLNRVHGSSDIVLLAELALKGTIRQCKEYLFFRRIGPSALSAARDMRASRKFFAAEGRDVHITPHLDLYRSCFRPALNAQIPWREKVKCLNFVGLLCRWNRSILWREAKGRIMASSPN